MLPRKAFDPPTLGLALLQCIGLVFVLLAHGMGLISGLCTVVISIFLMNLSFTVWHECSHGNFSRHAWINEAVGIISSFFSAYPGYFARRREHLAHHRFEGEPHRDPVYPRIQTNFLFFFWRLIVLLSQRNNPIPREFMPIKPMQRLVDRLTVGSFLGMGGLLTAYGYGYSFFYVFLIPRAAILLLHAFYICYLPHHVSGGGYQKYRIVSNSWFFLLLTVGQSLHGIHHLWPTIPWHRYGEQLPEYLLKFGNGEEIL